MPVVLRVQQLAVEAHFFAGGGGDELLGGSSSSFRGFLFLGLVLPHNASSTFGYCVAPIPTLRPFLV